MLSLVNPSQPILVRPPSRLQNCGSLLDRDDRSSEGVHQLWLRPTAGVSCSPLPLPLLQDHERPPSDTPGPRCGVPFFPFDRERSRAAGGPEVNRASSSLSLLGLLRGGDEHSCRSRQLNALAEEVNVD